NLDSILVGKYFGSLLLGQYDKAYQLMRYPLMLTTFAITPAIQPILVNFKDDIRFIEKEHNKLAFRLYSISIPITVFILFNAASIVRFLFGQQWELSITYVAILALSIPVQTVMSSSGAFFQVMNKPRLLFITGLITSFLNVLGIGIGVYFSSVELLCKFIVLTFIVNFIITYFILYRYCFCS
ncbi:oligosaccharide flippase family protein, partial [Escherichia coli]|nr:oligosaccharide flippase family protein [Escherichia coli]